MAESHVGLRIVVVVLLIATNAFFAAAEVALVAVRQSRLRQMAEEGYSGAHAALSLLANPERLLSVTQVGVTLASLGLGWAGEDTVYGFFVHWFAPLANTVPQGLLHAASLILAFLIISYLHVVIGEVVPKNLAIDKADRLAVTVAPALLVFYRITAVFVLSIARSSAAISRAVGAGKQHRSGGHSTEELKLIVSSSRGLGFLPEAQEDMIHGVLDLENLSVREVMVPRNDIVSISVEAGLDEVLETMITRQHSRLPVYEGAPEHIVGVLNYKDLLPVWEERRAAIRAGRPIRVFRIRRLMRRHKVVPETKPLMQLLEEFREGSSHMAVVVDEFGTIVGLITVEDVLEQIVGAIRDEFDEKVEPPPAAEWAEVEVDGTIRIRELETEYGIELPSDAGFETLAGFILFRLGIIPRAGDALDYEGQRYTVLAMEGNRIARVRIERSGEQAGPEEAKLT